MISQNFRTRLTENHKFIRLLEIIPGATTWTVLVFPIVFSIINPVVVMYYIIAYDLYWFFRALNVSKSILVAYKNFQVSLSFDWLKRCKETENVELGSLKKRMEKLSFRKAKKLRAEYNLLLHKIRDLSHLHGNQDSIADWQEVYQVIIFPTHKEEIEALEPAAEALLKSNYPLNKVIYCLVGEERDKERFRENAQILRKKYNHGKFFEFLTLEHPDGLPDEGKVKGAAVSWAAKEIRKMLHEKGIKSEQVIVSSLDCDTKVHPDYLAALAYKFVTTPDRHNKSFQSIPLFHNNLWDTPAPNRVMAVNSSFWQMIESIRLRRLRNFAGHAMSLKALEIVDYWDRFSIVEDGKQYWRSFFSFDGEYSVIPIFVPVYCDAVLSNSYLRTLKAQYLQRRRWYYGVSDFPYIVINAINNTNIPLWYRLLQVWRHYEGTVQLATGSLIVAFVAWLPLFLNPEFGDTSAIAHNLPIVASRILTVTAIGLVISMWISIILLPKRPKKYSKLKMVSMISQWLFLPPIVICLSTFPALESQTRVMFGQYIGWYVTPKCVKKDENKVEV